MKYKLLSILFLLIYTISLDAQTAEEVLLEKIATAEKFNNQNQVGDRAERQFFKDLSPSQMDIRKAYWEQLSVELDRLAKQLTTEEGRLNYEIYRYILDDRLAFYRYKYYLVPLNAEGGFLTSLSYLPNYTRIQSVASLENYRAKLKALPYYLGQQRYWL